MDATNIDLKSFNINFYKKLCGVELDNILETLLYIKKETKVWLELTTLLIPGENDSQEELEAMTSWVYENLGADTPWHFSAFHPSWKMQNKARTPLSTLKKASSIAKQAGMKYIYTGNVQDTEGGSSYCSECGKSLIKRDWYELSEWNLDENGCCKFCKTKLNGHFEKQAGKWGSKRQVIDINKY